MDARYGASRRGGAITVGVVVHSDSNVAGHGPGVTPLLVSATGGILPVYSPDANIALILGVRREIAPTLPPSARERSMIWRRAAQPALAPARALLPR
jgi:hypothetical protein